MDRRGDEAELLAELSRFRGALTGEFGPCRLILFGSRVRGDHLHTSDIDLIIISEGFAGMNFLKRMRRVLALWDGHISLEPRCYTPEEFACKKEEIGIVAVATQGGKEIG